MRVYLDTLGCRLNQAELTQWQDEFQERGHTTSVTDPKDAELLVINTCAVTAEAARKSRQLIRRAHRKNPQAKLVISGCYSHLNPQNAAALPGVSLIVDNQDKDKLVERVLQTMPQETFAVPRKPCRMRQRRAFVKVQDGCRHRCTFCIVTVARGTERSRPIAGITEQIRQLHREGVQEVVLSGVHLGGYGSDQGTDLGQLIEKVLSDTDIPRLRLGSLEPWNLPDTLLAHFSNPRLMPHLHLPLQSGCDRTLKRMARRCRSQDFAQLVETLRANNPHFNITTDIIVGFPGESESDWQSSLDFIKEMQFAHCHIFRYSRRRGTAADRFSEHVQETTKRARYLHLHALSARLRQEFLQRQIGRNSKVLWERHTPEGHWQGYTENYLRAILPLQTGSPETAMSTVRLVGIDATGRLTTTCDAPLPEQQDNQKMVLEKALV